MIPLGTWRPPRLAREEADRAIYTVVFECGHMQWDRNLSFLRTEDKTVSYRLTLTLSGYVYATPQRCKRCQNQS